MITADMFWATAPFSSHLFHLKTTTVACTNRSTGDDDDDGDDDSGNDKIFPPFPPQDYDCGLNQQEYRSKWWRCSAEVHINNMEGHEDHVHDEQNIR